MFNNCTGQNLCVCNMSEYFAANLCININLTELTPLVSCFKGTVCLPINSEASGYFVHDMIMLICLLCVPV